MKKLLSILVAITMLLGVFATTVSALDVAPKFTEHFFPEGKAGTPTNVYYKILKTDEGQVYGVSMWLTQADDVEAMFTELNEINDNDKVIETYGGYLENYRLQIDCKVDDGDWHYMPEWDKGEYPQENQPYDLALRQTVSVSDSVKTYDVGGYLIDPWYAQTEEDAGYLAPVILKEELEEETNYYLDFENHSLTLRARYFLTVRNNDLSDEDRDANDGSYDSYVLSDWSEEITIGKNGTQVPLEKPESIEAPTIKDLSFLSAESYEDDHVIGSWKVWVDFPQQNGDAKKYYVIEEDGFEPLNAVIEYRVKSDGAWGDWCYSYWGNSTWLDSGWKEFSTDGAGQNDMIEFRVKVENNMEEGKDSPYSNSLFCNVEDVKPVNGDTTGDGLVNMKDVLQLRKYVAGIVKEINENLADCNRDGSINMKDVLLLRKYLANLAELPEIYENIETDVTEVPWNE